MAGMCKMVNIPKHEFQDAVSAAFLYCFMTLISDSKPTLTPHELGQIMESQFKFFKELSSVKSKT